MSDDISTLKNRLEIMETVTEQCRKVIEDDGILYILWGTLAVIASGLTYAVYALGLPGWTVAFVWVLLFCGIGFTVTVMHVSRRKRRVRTFGSLVLDRMWAGIWPLFSCVFGLSFVPGISSQILAFIPFAFCLIYFPLAVLLDWKPFYFFAVLWILFGVAMLFVPGVLAFLVLDIAIVCCEIIPGIFLKLRASKRQKANRVETDHE